MPASRGSGMAETISRSPCCSTGHRVRSSLGRQRCQRLLDPHTTAPAPSGIVWQTNTQKTKVTRCHVSENWTSPNSRTSFWKTVLRKGKPPSEREL